MLFSYDNPSENVKDEVFDLILTPGILFAEFVKERFQLFLSHPGFLICASARVKSIEARRTAPDSFGLV